MSALAVEVLFSNPCAYLTESETLEKSKGYRHSRVSALLPGINLMSHFTCSRPEKSPISSCQRRLASTRLHQKPRGKRGGVGYRGVDSCLRRNDEGGNSSEFVFSSRAFEKIQKILCFQGLAFVHEKYSGQQCAYARNDNLHNSQR